MKLISGRRQSLVMIVLIAAILLPAITASATKLIIARDGAGQGFIENTLPPLSLAISNGVESIELRLVMTQDDELVVFKDLTLNRLTDVAEHFPEKHRPDGSFYVVDFTIDELRQLRLHNIFDSGSGSLSLPIPTFKETLALIRHLDNRFNHGTSIVIEPGYPAFHKQQGKDISLSILELLSDGLTLPEHMQVYLQSFDPDELQRLKDSLFASQGIEFPLIQRLDLHQAGDGVMDTQPDYSWIFTNSGLQLVATYASFLAIPGPALINSDGTMPLTGFIQEAHAKGLKILATSLHTIDETAMEADTPLLSRRLSELFDQAEIDGLYTDDFPAVQKYLQDKADELQRKEDLPPFFSTLELARPRHDMDQKPEEPSRNEAGPLHFETTEQF